MRLGSAICAAVLLLAGDAGGAARKPVEVRLRSDLYVARVDLTRIFTPEVKEKIESGLTTRIVFRAQAVEVPDGGVRSLAVVEYRVLYRVWEEDYLVTRWDALGETSFRLRTYADVVRRVGMQRRLAFAGRDDLKAGRRYQAVIEVEVDPISEELLAKVREYVANPGGHRREGGTRGLFGNLARIFFDPRSGPSHQSIVEVRSEVFLAGVRAQ